MWHMCVILSQDKTVWLAWYCQMAIDVILCHLKARQLHLRRQHGSPESSRLSRPGFRPRDPGRLNALLGFPIEINQRMIVSSPSEALAPASKKLPAVVPIRLLIKFRKFTLYFYSGIHRTGSIQDILIFSEPPFLFLPFFQKFFWNNSNQSCPVCQHCKFTPSCYRLW